MVEKSSHRFRRNLKICCSSATSPEIEPSNVLSPYSSSTSTLASAPAPVELVCSKATVELAFPKLTVAFASAPSSSNEWPSFGAYHQSVVMPTGKV